MKQGKSDNRALATGRTEIPPQHDPAVVGAPPVQAEFTDSANTQSPEDRAAKARADNEKYQDHQLNVSGVAQETGKITSAAGAQVNRQVSTEEAKEREKRAELTRLLAALDAQLAEIDFQIGVGARFAEDLANGKMPDLNEDGSIKDEEREKFIKDYEERTGAKIDRTDSDALKEAVDAQNEYLGKFRKDVARQRDGLDRSNNSTLEKEAVLADKGIGALRAQNSGQKTGLTSDTAENDEYKDNSQSALSLEDEVGKFMQNFAVAQKVENATERLEIEQKMVMSLSPKARGIIELGEDTEHLFAEEYFDKLSEESPVQQAGIDADPSPMSPV